MTATASIPAVGTAHGREFVSHKVSAPCSAMAGAAKDPDLINKIALFHCCKPLVNANIPSWSGIMPERPAGKIEIKTFRRRYPVKCKTGSAGAGRAAMRKGVQRGRLSPDGIPAWDPSGRKGLFLRRRTAARGLHFTAGP